MDPVKPIDSIHIPGEIYITACFFDSYGSAIKTQNKHFFSRNRQIVLAHGTRKRLPRGRKLSNSQLFSRSYRKTTNWLATALLSAARQMFRVLRVRTKIEVLFLKRLLSLVLNAKNLCVPRVMSACFYIILYLVPIILITY